MNAFGLAFLFASVAAGVKTSNNPYVKFAAPVPVCALRRVPGRATATVTEATRLVKHPQGWSSRPPRVSGQGALEIGHRSADCGRQASDCRCPIGTTGGRRA